MHPLRKKLNNNLVIRFLSSVKITVVCLSLLFILTLWGTIDQVNNGLYLSQERFFNSLIFTFWGFIPFPGARLVLWVLFINLVCVSLVRLVYQWSKVGIIIIALKSEPYSSSRAWILGKTAFKLARRASPP